MPKTLVKSLSPVGIHIGRNRIRAVQVGNNSRSASFVACGALRRRSEGPIPSEQDIADLVRALGRWGMCGNRVSVALPREMLKVDTLDLPPESSGAPIERLASIELARMHNVEPGSFEARCWAITGARRLRERSSVLAVACPSVQIETMLDLFELYGLDTVCMDTESWADTRACSRLGYEESTINAIVDLRWSITRMTFVYRGVVVYERAMPEKGMDRQARVIATRMGVDIDAARHLLLNPPQSSDGATALGIWCSEIKPLVNTHIKMIADDLRSAFGYATHQIGETSPGDVLMIGECSSVPGVAEHITELLDLKVRTVRINELVSADGMTAGERPADEFVTALGMALTEAAA